MASKKHNDVLLQLRKRVQGLKARQDSVAETREDVLVKRDSMMAVAKDIRKQRNHCAKIEAELMDLLRTRYHAPERSILKASYASYSNLEDERNNLRELEEEYARLAQELDASEWDLADSEVKLYQFDLQQLLSDIEEEEQNEPEASLDVVEATFNADDPVEATSMVREYNEAVADHKRLLNRFNFFRNHERVSEAYELPEVDGFAESRTDPELLSIISELLDDIAHCEVHIQNLKPFIYHFEGFQDLPIWSYSRTERSSSLPRKNVTMHSRGFSDGAVTPPPSGVSGPFLVQNWLLSRLRGSDLEKAQYMRILRGYLPLTNASEQSFEYWEQRVILHWLHDGTQRLFRSDPDPSHLIQNDILDEDSHKDQHDKCKELTSDPTLEGIGFGFEAGFGVTVQDAKDLDCELGDEITESDDATFSQCANAYPEVGSNKATIIGLGETELPILHITVPDDDHIMDAIECSPTEGLSVGGCALQRCDSAHNFDRYYLRETNNGIPQSQNKYDMANYADALTMEGSHGLSCSQRQRLDRSKSKSSLFQSCAALRPAIVDQTNDDHISRYCHSLYLLSPMVIHKSEHPSNILNENQPYEWNNLIPEAFGMFGECDGSVRCPTPLEKAQMGIPTSTSCDIVLHDEQNHDSMLRYRDRIQNAALYFDGLNRVNLEDAFVLGRIFEIPWHDKKSAKNKFVSRSLGRSSLMHFRQFIAVKNSQDLGICAKVPDRQAHDNSLDAGPGRYGLVYTLSSSPHSSARVIAFKQPAHVIA